MRERSPFGGGGSGGISGSGTGGIGMTGSGGATSTNCQLTPVTGAPGFGAPVVGGAGNSAAKYLGAEVTRDGVGYRFITNWWGQGWAREARG